MNVSTDKVEYIEFILKTSSKLHETANDLVESTQVTLNRLKSRRIASQDKIAVSARLLFPNIEPYVEHTNSSSDKPPLSNLSSFLRLNVGGKHFDISRSSLTQIQGSKLALIFSVNGTRYCHMIKTVESSWTSILPAWSRYSTIFEIWQTLIHLQV